ncbi:type II toxin-antitoxin system RatA family toxin [Spartinivicinus ruber]|uniref:type II toxin-antitoxin system RatA family toxin n=1 Tax=Spartinivicinus ruber TaxID=2683272 RepID=UPI0013D5721D|nr:type II toxin-antitoxin system RatA family toxin [Spartinivicinus ruber]
MTQISRSALVLYSARAMFNLVNDIKSYPHFLPWCVDTTIHEQTDKLVEATLFLAKGGLKHSFTTRNQLDYGNTITMELVEGPFKNLTGEWEFLPLEENACKVSLELHFEFSSKVMEATIGSLFNGAANTMVDAFCKRAKEYYG